MAQDEAGVGTGSVGLIGAGALGTALAEGLLAAGAPPGRLVVCNRADDDRLERLRCCGVRVTRDKAELAASVETLLLVVKPRDAGTALEELRPLLGPAHRVLSCVAGVPTPFVEEALGGRPRVLRAMPNIGSAIRASATALCAGRFAGPGDLDAAERLLGAVGVVVRVSEAAMDAVTAVAGSGPAYFYYLMEAMAEAATALGLPAEAADRLILQTAAGATRLALERERRPAELRAAVSSPGGTTVAGIAALDAAGFRQAVAAAVRSAAQRSAELGTQWRR